MQHGVKLSENFENVITGLKINCYMPVMIIYIYGFYTKKLNMKFI